MNSTVKLNISSNSIHIMKGAISEAILLLCEDSNNKHLIEDLEETLNVLNTIQDQIVE